MKIAIDGKVVKMEVRPIEEYAAVTLSGDRWEHGAVEQAGATADNATKALGRLLELLAEKGLLSAAEIVRIVELREPPPEMTEAAKLIDD